METTEEVAKWVKENLTPARGSLAGLAHEIDAEFGLGFTVETEGGRAPSRALRDELARIGVQIQLLGPAPKPEPLPNEDEP